MNIAKAIHDSIQDLQGMGEEVDPGHWQGVATEGKPDLRTVELMNVKWSALMPKSRDVAVAETGCNMPWAENHFLERVSRVPSNPGEEYKNWPWWHDQQRATMVEGKFTHTYQERFWPPRFIGIRYDLGNLDDVLKLLKKHPFTRQATFPIFFPEDTGAVHGGRIPCTLHYHFLRRGEFLHLWYAIRSCDAVRHYRDDVYMAIRLCQWVIQELKWWDVRPGFLHFTAYSFHVHKGDMHLL